MKIIDYSSRPPVAGHQVRAEHLQAYDRVYASAYKQARRDDTGPQALQAYLATYDKVGAEFVVVKARDAQTNHGYRVPNEVVADFCRAQGGRFIGFAAADPYKGAAALRSLEFAVRELRLRGLTLQPYDHQLAINDPRMYPLYAKCIELDIPLNLHCSTSFSAAAAMNVGHPQHLDEVMMHFPGLRVCATPPGWPWVHDLIAVAWRHPNVRIGLTAVRPKYLDVAHSGYGALLQYGNTVLQDRIVWGSAFPMQPVETALAELEALPLKDCVKEKWLYSNAARFLGV